MEISIIKADNWRVLVVNGEVKSQGHDLEPEQLLDALGLKYKSFYIEDRSSYLEVINEKGLTDALDLAIEHAKEDHDMQMKYANKDRTKRQIIEYAQQCLGYLKRKTERITSGNVSHERGSLLCDIRSYDGILEKMKEHNI